MKNVQWVHLPTKMVPHCVKNVAQWVLSIVDVGVFSYVCCLNTGVLRHTARCNVAWSSVCDVSWRLLLSWRRHHWSATVLGRLLLSSGYVLTIVCGVFMCVDIWCVCLCVGSASAQSCPALYGSQPLAIHCAPTTTFYIVIGGCIVGVRSLFSLHCCLSLTHIFILHPTPVGDLGDCWVCCACVAQPLASRTPTSSLYACHAQLSSNTCLSRLVNNNHHSTIIFCVFYCRSFSLLAIYQQYQTQALQKNIHLFFIQIIIIINNVYISIFKKLFFKKKTIRFTRHNWLSFGSPSIHISSSILSFSSFTFR